MFASACSIRAGSARRRTSAPAPRAQRALLGAGAGGEAVRDALQQLARAQVGRPHGQPALVGARDHQQVVGELVEAVGLLRRGARPPPPALARAAPAQRQLELSAQDRQRRAQLVAGVGDERALAQQRGLQAAEHLVERVAEARDLVVRGRHGEPAAGLAGGQRRGPAAHPLDRPQRGGGHGVAGERGDQQRERAADGQQRVQALERPAALLERLADDDHDRRRWRCRARPGEQADARRRAAVDAGAAVVTTRRSSRGPQLADVSSGSRPAAGVVSSTRPSGRGTWASGSPEPLSRPGRLPWRRSAAASPARASRPSSIARSRLRGREQGQRDARRRRAASPSRR